MSGCGRRGLVWCGGDASGYVQVEYVIGSKNVATFLAPAALHSVYDYSALAVMIPQTLFAEKPYESYRLLLEAKSGWGGLTLVRNDQVLTQHDQEVHRLLQRGFECYVVPHPGVASPITLSASGSTIAIEYGKAQTFECSFNSMLNTAYRWLLSFAEEHGLGELHVDLTHGSNVMVSSLLIAATILREALPIDVRFWSAPILGRPQAGQVVEVLDVTDAVRAQTEVISGAVAWRNLDERVLPLEYFRDLGARLGARHKGLYSHVRDFLEEAGELLWGLRSGQALTVIEKLRPLSQKLEDREKEFRGLLEREFPRELGGIRRDLCRESPWVPVVHAALQKTRDLLSRLDGGDGYEVMQNILRLYSERELYDKALCVGREWLVLLLLRRLGLQQVRCGEGEWARVDNILTKLGRGEAMTPEDGELLSQLGTTKEYAKVFEKTRSFRNKLMHGRMSKEDAVVMDISRGVPTRKVKIIGKDELNEVTEELLELINKQTAQR